MRLFTAIDIDDNLRNNITQVQKQLKKHNWDVKWVEKENLHITLCFIGEVEKNQLGGLQKRLAQAGGEIDSFQLTVEKLQILKRRVVSLSMNGEAPQFAKLQKGIKNAVDDKGTKTYPPHITLGRFRRGSSFSSNANNLPAFSYDAYVKVNSFALYSSSLTPQGPIYTKMSSFSLGF